MLSRSRKIDLTHQHRYSTVVSCFFLRSIGLFYPRVVTFARNLYDRIICVTIKQRKLSRILITQMFHILSLSSIRVQIFIQDYCGEILEYKTG